jgi:hypothetical protein
MAGSAAWRDDCTHPQAMGHVCCRSGAVLVVFLGAACTFDRAGLPASQRSVEDHRPDAWRASSSVDAVRSLPEPDGGTASCPDLPALPDIQSTGFADAGPVAPDGGLYGPLTTGALLAQWVAEQAPCVDVKGKPAGPSIPIIDTATVQFIDGKKTLKGAPAATKAWVGAATCVAVLWDPNACDDENPTSSASTTWDTAALLVRGAVLDAQGRLILEPWVTVQDINLVNATPDGSFETPFDPFGPDDQGLASWPPLVGTVQVAKASLLAAAQGP